MHLSELTAPEGVTFLDDPEETIIATVTVPTEEPEEPEIEEETELVGEEGAEAVAGRRGRRRARAPTAATRPASPAASRTSPEPLRRRRGKDDGDDAPTGRADWLIVGLGNPGDRYARTRHNIGFEVANELGRRWDLPRAKKKYAGLFTEGRTMPGGPRVALLLPQTFMNESGQGGRPGARRARRAARPRARHPRRDRPAVRPRRGAPGRRARRPQRAEVAQARARRRRTSTASASASAGPTRPTRRSCPRTCSAASASRRTTCGR